MVRSCDHTCAGTGVKALGLGLNPAPLHRKLCEPSMLCGGPPARRLQAPCEPPPTPFELECDQPAAAAAGCGATNAKRRRCKKGCTHAHVFVRQLPTWLVIRYMLGAPSSPTKQQLHDSERGWFDPTQPRRAAAAGGENNSDKLSATNQVCTTPH